MTGPVLASLLFLGSVLIAVLGELINEEVRGWIDYLPRVILRLAARRLDPAGKITIYEDEWLPELTCILRGAEARPISRVILGVKYSAVLLVKAERIASHLHRTMPDPAQPHLSRVATAPAAEIAPAGSLLQLLTATVEQVETRYAVVSEQWHCAAEALDHAERATAREEAAPESPAFESARCARDAARKQLDDLTRHSAEIEQELWSLVLMQEEQRQRLVASDAP
jgi:hypothetical protein